MQFKEMIRQNKFSLVVSLPSNDLELAKAAMAKQNKAVGTAGSAAPVTSPARKTHTQAVKAMFARRESHCRNTLAAMCFLASGTISMRRF